MFLFDHNIVNHHHRLDCTNRWGLKRQLGNFLQSVTAAPGHGVLFHILGRRECVWIRHFAAARWGLCLGDSALLPVLVTEPVFAAARASPCISVTASPCRLKTRQLRSRTYALSSLAHRPAWQAVRRCRCFPLGRLLIWGCTGQLKVQFHPL